jgi:hypothetical protein
MKKIVSFILAASISMVAFAQPTTQAISEKVKVVFPGKPEEVKAPNGALVYNYVKDSVTAYMGMSFDLSALGLTAEVIASAGDAMWEQMKGPMVAQMAGGTLAKDEVTTFKGKSSLYMEIDGTNSTAPQLKGKKAFGYVFFIGSVLHQVIYYSSDPAAKKDNAATFFDSVVVSD